MKRSDKKGRRPEGPAGNPGTAAGDKAAVVKVWRCTISEEWDDEPAFRVIVPPGTDTEELERFLVKNEYVEAEMIVPPFWLDEGNAGREAAEPGDDDLILERDRKGKLRVKED